MKIRLAVGKESMDEVQLFLSEHGIELDDDSEFILIQKSKYVSRLPVKNSKSGEKIYLSTKDIIYLESFGHNVFLHAINGDYVTSEPLYQLELMINPERFVRVSASVIVSHVHIKQITAMLSQKYALHLSNGAIVDVTRSYYHDFKERFGL